MRINKNSQWFFTNCLVVAVCLMIASASASRDSYDAFVDNDDDDSYSVSEGVNIQAGRSARRGGARRGGDEDEGVGFAVGRAEYDDDYALVEGARAGAARSVRRGGARRGGDEAEGAGFGVRRTEYDDGYLVDEGAYAVAGRRATDGGPRHGGDEDEGFDSGVMRREYDSEDGYHVVEGARAVAGRSVRRGGARHGGDESEGAGFAVGRSERGENYRLDEGAVSVAGRTARRGGARHGGDESEGVGFAVGRSEYDDGYGVDEGARMVAGRRATDGGARYGGDEEEGVDFAVGRREYDEDYRLAEGARVQAGRRVTSGGARYGGDEEEGLRVDIGREEQDGRNYAGEGVTIAANRRSDDGGVRRGGSDDAGLTVDIEEKEGVDGYDGDRGKVRVTTNRREESDGHGGVNYDQDIDIHITGHEDGVEATDDDDDDYYASTGKPRRPKRPIKDDDDDYYSEVPSRPRYSEPESEEVVISGESDDERYNRRQQSHCSHCFYWSDWLSADNPDGRGDYETLGPPNANGVAGTISRTYPDVCVLPVRMECRERRTHVPWYLTGDQITSQCVPNQGEGFKCEHSKQQNGQKCKDYEVRLLCMRPCRCFYWSKWFDRTCDGENGDIELLGQSINTNPCGARSSHNPLDVQCQTHDGRDIYNGRDRKLSCDLRGFSCYNRDQPRRRQCKDYKVRFLCSKYF